MTVVVEMPHLMGLTWWQARAVCGGAVPYALAYLRVLLIKSSPLT